MEQKTLWFDMDGTLADLYSVDGWLDKLRVFDPSPYANATPLLNMSKLAYALNRAQEKGWKLGIISWSSKVSTAEYDLAVARAKKQWLNTHLTSVSWDFIYIKPYGYDKVFVAQTMQDILFDDEDKNCENWRLYGRTAFHPEHIMGTLQYLGGK